MGLGQMSDPQYVVAADHALRSYEAGEVDPAGFWFSAGGDREDARQSAIIRAWQAESTFDGSTDLMLHLVANARYGILDYARSLDREVRRTSPQRRRARDKHGRVLYKENGKPVWEPERDLDGIPLTDLNGKPIFAIDTARVEYEPRTECRESESEVHGEDASSSKDRVALRSMLETMFAGVLEDRERQVVAMSFGLDGTKRTHAEISQEIGISRSRVTEVLGIAMAKLRAEAQAEKIMGL